MPLYTTTTGASGIQPEDYGALLVEPVDRESIALDVRVSTKLTTSSSTMHLPVVRTDVQSAFVAEGAEISPSDPGLDDVEVTPKKVAGLTVVSTELAESSDPAAAALVGDSLGRSIASKIDEALFKGLSSPAPTGLATLSGMNAVSAGASFSNLDWASAAVVNAEEHGSSVTSFVMSPSTALLLLQLKDETGSNRQLIGSDPTTPTTRTIAGVPMVISPHVAANTIYAMAADRVQSVVSRDVRVDVDGSAFFTSDRIGVRGTLRIAWGFPSPSSLSKITLAEA
jgi:HK97 family phage major capsid protein